MIIIYRISNNSNARERIATKEQCLRNFLSVWFDLSGISDSGNADEVNILMDHLDEPTYAMVLRATRVYRECGLDLHLLNVSGGSSEKAMRGSIEIATVPSIPDDVYVYLVEDDYLHLRDARQVLLEGLNHPGVDYVSLYDHPDKYMEGRIAPTHLVRTPSSHWRVAESTTGTFAASVKTLREDWHTWRFYTSGQHGRAWDHAGFTSLAREKGRILLTPIPGLSTHCDKAWLAPGVDWSAVR